MSYDSTRQFLYQALIDTLDIEGIPYRFDSILDDDPITTGDLLWVRAYISPIETFQHSIGTSSPIERTIGLFIIEIYDRKANGYADILRAGETIKDIYYRKSFDNGKIRIQRVKLSKRQSYNNWNSNVLIIHYIEDQ